jgi:ubiquinone/menaquinone biosynthesis C-methylase UbiE
VPLKGQFEAGFWDDYARGQAGGREEALARGIRALSPTMLLYAERAFAEARLAPGSRVLDVGTGTGTMAVVAARGGMHVLATDFSEVMVNQVVSYGIPNLEARQMDGQSLDLDDATFDAAFSMFSVTLFGDWRAGLAEMARVVRPGGVGTVGTWTSPGGASAARALFLLCQEMFPDLPGPEFAKGIIEMQDVGRFRSAMLTAGFIDVNIVYETQDWEIRAADLEDPDRLFTFTTQWKLLDQRRQQQVLNVMRSQISLDGRYLVGSTAGIATGRRPED